MTGVHGRVGDDGVAVVTIDRPQARNALDWDAWESLGRLVAELDRDDVRAVVLTGGDRWFSAGGDVTSMGSRQGSGVTGPAARVRLAHRVVRALTGCRAPVVAAVEGFAIGAAWGLVLACDLVVASREAFFLAPFAQRALVADAGLAWSLSRHVGHQRAAELLLVGARLPAVRAQELGLVNRVVEPGEAGEQALELARGLAAGPADAVQLTKALLCRAPQLSLDSFLDEEHVHVALNGHSPDVAEGRQTFLDKRPPRFR
ncbi:enoyl-CoA hydratase/isomerase family protein [Geodermatophilus sp. DSM 44513]|uniref:enoyl-CoA hydratase/isomerase family protein n=1 Tax=Geodermatophilus sp. DSM 44513 TaxID=1528104 RepID=UPI00128838D7|nr:enoyl-CoA hydratase-related protein [Geodermatophilus sp. DSM 44513]WNV76639.1 enoyl-CoA hydratase-related protein [Geodermatophilus sp. DSM 44513]